MEEKIEELRSDFEFKHNLLLLKTLQMEKQILEQQYLLKNMQDSTLQITGLLEDLTRIIKDKITL